MALTGSLTGLMVEAPPPSQAISAAGFGPSIPWWFDHVHQEEVAANVKKNNGKNKHSTKIERENTYKTLTRGI